MAEDPKPPKSVRRPQEPLRRPEEARVFRQFLDWVDRGWIDRASFGARHPGFSFTLAKLLAAAADLAALAALLEREAVEGAGAAELSPVERSLLDLAAAFAPRLAALVRDLEREIARRVPEDLAPEGPAGGAG